MNIKTLADLAKYAGVTAEKANRLDEEMKALRKEHETTKARVTALEATYASLSSAHQTLQGTHTILQADHAALRTKHNLHLIASRNLGSCWNNLIFALNQWTTTSPNNNNPPIVYITKPEERKDCATQTLPAPPWPATD